MEVTVAEAEGFKEYEDARDDNDVDDVLWSKLEADEGYGSPREESPLDPLFKAPPRDENEVDLSSSEASSSDEFPEFDESLMFFPDELPLIPSPPDPVPSPFASAARSLCLRFLNQLLTWVVVNPVASARSLFSRGEG